MRISRFSVLLLAALACIGAPCAAAQLVPVPYTASFELAAPPDWAVYRDMGAMRLIALSPKDDETDAFQENVNVVLDGLLPGVTWEMYLDNGLALMQQSMADFERVESSEAAFGPYPARRLVFEHSATGRRLRVLSYTVLVGDRVYVVTGTAPEDTFAKYLGMFEEMAQSLSVD